MDETQNCLTTGDCPLTTVIRFAPSPTGYLHLGHAYSAWTGWQKARARGGVFRLRLEDIDSTRCKPEYAAAIQEDLRWLGLDWDGAVRVQSEHLPDYAAALDKLQQRGLLYPCFCSRAEIIQAQAAPHNAIPAYPGTCRHLSESERSERIAQGQPYARRLNIRRAAREAHDLRFFEEAEGLIKVKPAPLGDVVLARRDVPTSYHLCVVHDDALQGISHITRGIDLKDATPIHVLLQRLLNLPSPVYAHHRLLTDASGKRLAKRDFAATLRSFREAGDSPSSVLDRIVEHGKP